MSLAGFFGLFHRLVSARHLFRQFWDGSLSKNLEKKFISLVSMQERGEKRHEVKSRGECRRKSCFFEYIP